MFERPIIEPQLGHIQNRLPVGMIFSIWLTPIQAEYEVQASFMLFPSELEQQPASSVKKPFQLTIQDAFDHVSIILNYACMDETSANIKMHKH